MSVKARFQAIPVKVFDRFGDVAFNITYRSRLPDNYVPGGMALRAWEDHTVRTVREEYTLTEQNQGTIKDNDFKLLIAVVELKVTPKPDDRVIMPDTREFSVINVSLDPASAMYTLQVRG